METPNYYAVLPASVRYDTALSASEKLMYAEITALSNKTGECWASNGYFAGLYGVSKFTVSRWISSMTDKNFLRQETVKGSQGSPDRRLLMVVDKTFIRPDGVDENRKGVDENVNRGVDEKVNHNNTSINTNIYGEFLEGFNRITGRKFRILDTKAKRQLSARLKEGFSLEDLFSGVRGCAEDKYHKENPQYLTPEFITRADKLQKYMNNDDKAPSEPMKGGMWC